MEKTFEELIEDKLTATTDGYVVYTDDILELLQQVREATIAECLQLATKETFTMSRKAQFDLIPINRIKIEK